MWGGGRRGLERNFRMELAGCEERMPVGSHQFAPSGIGSSLPLIRLARVEKYCW